MGLDDYLQKTTGVVVTYPGNPISRAMSSLRCIHCGTAGHVAYYGYARGQKDGSLHVTAHCNHCGVRGPVYRIETKPSGLIREWDEKPHWWSKTVHRREEVIDYTFTPL